MRIQSFIIGCSLLLMCNSGFVFSQTSSGISDIIQKIYDLEKDKDPKCYATANRLEDFMFGTPLDDDARNFKIDFQKTLIYYLKEKGTELALKQRSENITRSQIKEVLQGISEYGNAENGDYYYKLTTGTITIKNKDFRQYSSVSYGYRSLLSVEQDLIFAGNSNLLPPDTEALQLINDYVNLLTLVVLKIADINARKSNETRISKKRLKESWILILSESRNGTFAKATLPKIRKPEPSLNHNTLAKEIIAQKVRSYEKYNNLSASVFLRNIQVYFARQKWPVGKTESDELRAYYLESLVEFAKELLIQSDANAKKSENAIIRAQDVKQAIQLFLPSNTNSFEDVTFFPNSGSGQITVESYDLDAFRDSGFHWRILGYAIDDLQEKPLKSIDPNAAEQLVEGIAELGVLVLRLAGEESRKAGKSILEIEDLNRGFKKIQNLISTYDFAGTPVKGSNIVSSNSEGNSYKFIQANEKVGLNFAHKSADWLNRLIRSYAVSEDEGVIKLSVPPAFGGSGVAAEDINGDGLADVLLLSGFGNKLFLNTSLGPWQDITELAGINHWNETSNSYGEPRQPIIADFNNDGLQDIFITYVNEPHRMYHNVNGTEFHDVTKDANLGGEYAVGGPATALDFDNDGLLDIFIGYFGNYPEGKLPTLSRDNQNGMPNKLFRNLGNFQFVEVVFTEDIGSNTGWTQAVGHTDLNQDGLQDLIVGNDFGKNKYYLNSSSGKFTEVSAQLGTDKPSYTMNIGITDLNNDLYPDLYISNIVVMQKEEKYVSPNAEMQMKFDPEKMANIRTIEANDLFLSSVAGDMMPKYSLSDNIGRGYSATGWSWDADFFDFDNDGDQDLYCLNGMNDFSVYSSENPFYFERAEQSKSIVYAESDREKNVLFVNEGGVLMNKAEEYGLDLNSNARSAAYLDFDSDGDLDIIINNYHDNADLLENNNPASNNWIKIKLIGDPKAKVNRDAIGSTLILTTSENRRIWREIHSTTGYLSVHPKQQHFGLGKAHSVSATVRWSNGTLVSLSDLQSNTTYEIAYPDILEVRN